jgi:hypothetical protein
MYLRNASPPSSGSQESNLMMEAIHFSETLVPTRATWCNIPEDGILHSYRSENLKPYIFEPYLCITLLMFICSVPIPFVFQGSTANITKHIPIKNGVFWDVTPCGSCKYRRFGENYRLLHQGDKNE